MKTFIAGIIIVVVGVALIFVATIVPYPRWTMPDHQFIVPGRTEVTLDAPGRYIVWNNTRTTFEGRRYRSSSNLPGYLDFDIRTADGRRIERHYEPAVSMSRGDDVRRVAFSFVVDQAGDVVIEATGPVQPRVLVINDLDVWRQYLWANRGVKAGIAIIVLGLAAMIIGIVRHARS